MSLSISYKIRPVSFISLCQRKHIDFKVDFDNLFSPVILFILLNILGFFEKSLFVHANTVFAMIKVTFGPDKFRCPLKKVTIGHHLNVHFLSKDNRGS